MYCYLLKHWSASLKASYSPGLDNDIQMMKFDDDADDDDDNNDDDDNDDGIWWWWAP